MYRLVCFRSSTGTLGTLDGVLKIYLPVLVTADRSQALFEVHCVTFQTIQILHNALVEDGRLLAVFGSLLPYIPAGTTGNVDGITAASGIVIILDRAFF